MSTHCVITVKDEAGKFHIYRHSDGYPDNKHGVIAGLQQVINETKIWELPRFEADEFAAGIIATLKKSHGDYRFSKGPQNHGDLAFCYVVEQFGQGIKVTWKSTFDKSYKGTEFLIRET